MSARRHTDGRSRVRLCATVTVQFAIIRSCANGFPTMFDPPYNDRLKARKVAMNLLQHQHATEDSTRHQCLSSDPQKSNVRDVETVDVLVWRDRIDDTICIHVRRERQLDQYARRRDPD